MSTQLPRFMKFVYEFEVEVTDPLAARAATLELSTRSDADGVQGVYTPHGGPAWEMAVALSLPVSQMMSELDDLGIKYVASSLRPREVDENGLYKEMVLYPEPARSDDGSFSDI